MAFLMESPAEEWGGNSATVIEFEERFAAHVGGKHCIATANGTLAIAAALKAVDVRPGDEVIVPSYTFPATATPAIALGATPVVVDVDPDTLAMSADAVEAAISPRTRAVVPVHLYGHPADVPAIVAIARKHDLSVVLDSAHRPAKNFLGDIACFSFESRKLISSGEGGAVVTNNAELAQSVRQLVNHGRSKRQYGDFVSLGLNARMSAWQAAVLMHQLNPVYEVDHELRIRSAQQLSPVLRQGGLLTGCGVLQGDLGEHALYALACRYDPEFSGLSISTFLAALSAEGVPCSRGYRRILPDWPATRQRVRVHSAEHGANATASMILFPHRVLSADEGAHVQLRSALTKIMTHADKLRAWEVSQ